MDLGPLLGYVAAVLIGALLGLVGGGGAILALPVLVHAFALPPQLATSYTLLIVGLSSALGAVRYARQGLIDYQAALRFAVPALLAIHLVRRLLLPRMPTVIDIFGYTSVTMADLLMAVLLLLMLSSGLAMLVERPPLAPVTKARGPRRLFLTSLRGFSVGVLTGLVGAGGGFLLVPALGLIEGLPLKRAVATSLAVISINSLLGFAGDLAAGVSLDWQLLSWFTGFSLIGMMLGTAFSGRLPERAMRKGFAWFLLLLAGALAASQVLT